jgi:hypothetical protein
VQGFRALEFKYVPQRLGCKLHNYRNLRNNTKNMGSTPVAVQETSQMQG